MVGERERWRAVWVWNVGLLDKEAFGLLECRRGVSGVLLALGGTVLEHCEYARCFQAIGNAYYCLFYESKTEVHVP